MLGKILTIWKDLAGPVETQAGNGGITQKGKDGGGGRAAFGGEGSVWRVKDALASLDDPIWGKAIVKEDFKDIMLCGPSE